MFLNEFLSVAVIASLLNIAFSIDVSKEQKTIDIVIPQVLKTVFPSIINETSS